MIEPSKTNQVSDSGGAQDSPGKALKILLCVLVLFIPYQYHFPRNLGIPGMNPANLLFLVIFLLLPKRSFPNDPAPLKGFFFFFIFALTVSVLVSQFKGGVSADADIVRYKDVCFWMLLYFLYYRAVQDEATIVLLLKMMALVTFIASLHGIRQAIDYGIGVYVEERRASGPFGADFRGANAASIFYVMFMPIALSALVQYRSQLKLRLICGIFIAAAILAIFVTYSRQAYFILAALFVIIFLRRKPILLPFVLVALLTYEAWVPEGVVKRIQMTNQGDEYSEKKFDESTESRWIIWEGAIKLIQEQPEGVGLQRFSLEIGRYVPMYENMDAHNGFVLFATEAGLLGFIAMVSLFVRLIFFGRAAELIDDDERTKIIGAAYMLSAIAMCMGNLYGSRFFNGEIMGNFWIFTALVARYSMLRREHLKTVNKDTIEISRAR